jgi:recombination DNA repair RAD52 pathway protein
MAFSEAQLKNLEAKLDSKHVRTRRAQDTTLAYVEGWHVIAEANRIFGYDAWDRHTLSTRCVWSGASNHHAAAAYIAKVRIAVRAGAIVITREGCGSGNAKAPTPGEAHELALKAAETDATKRALATFGNPFGLALYDRELAGVKNRKALTIPPEDYRGPWLLSLPNGGGQSFTKADEFISALSKALTEATDIERLFALWERNVDTVRSINKQTHRSTPRGAIAPTLAAHFKRRAIALAKQNAESAAEPSDQPNQKIDKSVLTISEPKRVRSKEHLRFVAQQPCVICGRTPSHAHHVRYAQSRGLALKVSDEFTVPLCAIHHGENHATGHERQWWVERKIDPLAVAAELWATSQGAISRQVAKPPEERPASSASEQ